MWPRGAILQVVKLSPDEVRAVEFQKTPFGRRGYHVGEVDAFLDRVADTLRGADDVTVHDVHQVIFSRAPLGRRGYREDEVDAFLDEVEVALGQ